MRVEDWWWVETAVGVGTIVSAVGVDNGVSAVD